MIEQEKSHSWITIERPGYLGKRKDAYLEYLNQTYGEGKWRLVWEMASSEIFDYPQIFWNIYVPGYLAYFLSHPGQARFITDNFSFAYDKEIVSRADAFDPMALYDKPGHANQFHNVALNIALEWYLGLPFKGNEPIQVREGKPGTPIEQQPKGYLWSPGRIPAVRKNLIIAPVRGWWQPGSIEDVYQSTKAVQI